MSYQCRAWAPAQTREGVRRGSGQRSDEVDDAIEEQGCEVPALVGQRLRGVRQAVWALVRPVDQEHREDKDDDGFPQNGHRDLLRAVTGCDSSLLLNRIFTKMSSW